MTEESLDILWTHINYHKNSFDIGQQAILLDQIFHHFVMNINRAIIIEPSDSKDYSEYPTSDKIRKQFPSKLFYIGDYGTLIFFDEKMKHTSSVDKARYVRTEAIKIKNKGKIIEELYPITLKTMQKTTLKRIYK
jgi:hypothetical protein